MATSPWHHRHKPRHARPRTPRLCLTCLAHCLEAITSPAGPALLLHQPDAPLPQLTAIALLALRLADHHPIRHQDEHHI
jgi:hypothetical protein